MCYCDPPFIPVAEGSGHISKGGCRGRRADVWRHFTLFEVHYGKKPVVKVKKLITTYATCNYCGVIFKAESIMGTSTCKNHYEKCKHKPEEKIGYASITSFEQKLWLSKLAKAIISHAYPLQIVEHEFFGEAITYLNRNVLMLLLGGMPPIRCSKRLYKLNLH